MKTVYMIRHGQTPGNAEKRYSGGRTDESLCEEGIKVAKEAKKTYDEIFAPYEGNFRICVSPLKRAVETAGILFGEDRDDFTKIDNLKEIDFGIFEGKTYDELNGTPEFQAWVDSGGKDPVPEAETFEDFAKRIYDYAKLGIDEIVKPNGGNLVLFNVVKDEHVDYCIVKVTRSIAPTGQAAWQAPQPIHFS